jgi:prolyl-tRNA editing enzyme YbaK/EbsC (Cys-tRNA(Pro) deacylase)
MKHHPYNNSSNAINSKISHQQYTTQSHHKNSTKTAQVPEIDQRKPHQTIQTLVKATYPPNPSTCCTIAPTTTNPSSNPSRQKTAKTTKLQLSHPHIKYPNN